MLIADAKSAVLLRVPSLIKVAVRNFPLLHFPRWLCLVHGQLAISPRRVKRSFIRKCQFSLSSIFNNGQFYLKYYFLRHRVYSSKCQLLRLCSQFSFTKTLKVLQALIFTHFGGTSQGPPINVSYWLRQTKITETPSDLIFEHIFKKAFLYRCFLNIYYR